MIVVIVHHWCEPNMKEASIARIDGNGDSMAGVPGFLFRYRLDAPTDALKLSTVTAWESEQAYRQWQEIKRSKSDGGTPNPYSRVETEVLVVASIHDAPGAATVLQPFEGGVSRA